MGCCMYHRIEGAYLGRSGNIDVGCIWEGGGGFIKS